MSKAGLSSLSESMLRPMEMVVSLLAFGLTIEQSRKEEEAAWDRRGQVTYPGRSDSRRSRQDITGEGSSEIIIW